MVKASRVPKELYTGEYVHIAGYGVEQGDVYPTARITLDVGPFQFVKNVAVIPDNSMQQDALLDLLFGSLEMKTLVAISMQREAPAEKVLITRVQQAAVDMEQIRIEEAEEEDQLIPKDPSIVQPVDLEQEEALSEDRPEELPLQCPIATEGGIIRKDLVTAEDSTLESWRHKADNTEGGLWWDNGLLRKTLANDLGEHRHVTVIPTIFRSQLLQLVHDNNGHLGSKKIKASLQRHVTWPNLNSDVSTWCLQCFTCQRNRRGQAPKAPMQEVLVLTEPFEKVAIDLVGTFERAASGHRFLLTAIDLATRYPEAIPLKSATAEEVAEGLLETSSRDLV